MSEIECTNYKHIGKGVVFGSATVYVPKWGIEIFNITVFQKDGKRWIAFPSREADGEDGKKKYYPYIRFKNQEHMNMFSEKVKKAIEKFCGESQQPSHSMQEEIPF